MKVTGSSGRSLSIELPHFQSRYSVVKHASASMKGAQLGHRTREAVRAQTLAVDIYARLSALWLQEFVILGSERGIRC